MPAVDAAATPQFEDAARCLLSQLERLPDDSEGLELALRRLENMIATQRQWARRAARAGDGDAALSLLEALERGLARARGLVETSGEAPQGGV